MKAIQAIKTKKLLRCDMIAKLAEHEPEAFARFCEKLYSERLQAACSEIEQAGRGIVMLTGPSATGKTTSAHKLAAELAARGKKTAVLSLDDFFVGEGRYPKHADGTDDYECLEALDVPRIRACLKALHETGECEAPIFDFLTQMPSAKTQHIDCRGGVVIIEGLHAFNPQLTEALPADAVLCIYASLREEYMGGDGKRLLATRDIRLARRLVRDWKFRGHDADFTLGLWANVCAAEDIYIKRFKNRADLLFDTSFAYEVCLWEDILQELSSQKYPERLEKLRQKYGCFTPLSTALVPPESMLREFIGKK